MDKELENLLVSAAIKFKEEAEPLLESKQLNRSPTVRAYSNIINQQGPEFANILDRYMSGDIGVDETVRKLNAKETTLIGKGSFFKGLQGHHIIYQKLLGNRLFNQDPKTALLVVKNLADKLPDDIQPGTDPNKLIYTSRDLHRFMHGGAFKNLTSGGLQAGASVDNLLEYLDPNVVEAVYNAEYVKANPAQKQLINKIGEALGVTNPDQLDTKAKGRLLRASKDFPFDANQLSDEVLRQGQMAGQEFIPPDASNVFKLGSKPTIEAVQALAQQRGEANIGLSGLAGAVGLVTTPEFSEKMSQGNVAGAFAAGLPAFAQGEVLGQVVQKGMQLTAKAGKMVLTKAPVLGPASIATTTGAGLYAAYQNIQKESAKAQRQYEEVERKKKMQPTVSRPVNTQQLTQLTENMPDPVVPTITQSKPKTKPQQPKSAVAKIIDNPLNELKYIGKQALRGIKKINGAILFGY